MQFFSRWWFERRRALDAISQDLAYVRRQVDVLAHRQEEFGMDLTKLQNAVANETTVDQSVLTLVTTMAQEIKDANASGNQAAVDAAADQIIANANAIAAAVAANTPAAPTTTAQGDGSGQ